ncbi:MAG TPA: hypothetical protein PLL88_01025 [Anaerolineaceae bacterium]|nr:hypothetical protein [Anaerolineaceae bacterium]
MKKRHLSRFCFLATFLLILFPHAAFASAQGAGESWQLTTQVGGTTQAIFIEGNTLYLGVGMHVEIFDVSNVQQPTLLGSSPILPNFVESIFSDGSNYLYIACGKGGLQILDITNPASPRLVGSYNTRGYTEDVYLKGKNAILADGPNGIQILDVTTPTNPAWVSEAYPLAYTYDVEMSGNTLFAAAGGSGLLVVDLNDITHPQEKGIVSMDGFLYSLAIADKKMYSANAWGGLGVIDISDPLAPSTLDAIQTDGWVMDVFIQDSNLLAMDGTDGVRLYSIGGQTPQLQGVYADTGFTYQGILQGKNAFVTDKEQGLLILDFTSASNPRLLDQYLPILDARRVTMSGKAAYIAGGLSGMRAIDISDPNNPEETFWFDTEGGYANKVLVEGDVAYLSTHLATEYPLRTFDISDPLHPQLRGQVPNDEAVYQMAFRSMAYSNGYLFIPGEFFDGAVDVRDPANPLVVGRIPLENPINADAYGDLLITVNNNQLQLVDITDAANLTQISTFERTSAGEGIIFFDETTVITSSDTGIMLVDVSTPSSPREISNLTVAGTVMEIFLDGNTAYLSCLGGGIQIVDLSDLETPVLIGSVETPGIAYDCFVQGNLLLVADSFGGLLIFQRNATGNTFNNSGSSTAWIQSRDRLNNGANIHTVSSERTVRSFNTEGIHENQKTSLQSSSTCTVTTTADDGSGSLRECISNLREGMTITFDTQIFSPSKPATIQPLSPLPAIEQSTFTIDASNAGVILDGSQLESGNGLEWYSSNSMVMGLQITNFPENGIRVNGDNNQIGGNRLSGEGPTGEGNLLSGNGINGIILYGNNNVISGNLIGTDVKGTSAFPNYYGVFISEWCKDTIVGGISAGEGNVISGNTFTNLDTWGNHTQVMGNLIGLDITGSKAIKTDSRSNIVIESGASNTVIGGTQPEMRNIISGSDLGIIMSDPNSYQNSVIGNYIGTDITGTKAIPNNTGLTIWTVSFNRVGGTAAGEGNLISGNQIGINLNGYGVTDNIILGNTIGLDASGEKLLEGSVGISINMGQKHDIIGGYTSAEGNRVAARDIAMRISEPGIEYLYIAGNTISSSGGSGIYFESRSSKNFVQNNSFSQIASNAVRVDYGIDNQLRANTFAVKAENAILLLENGNLNLPAPVVDAATTYSVSGTTCSNCLVELYIIAENTLQYAGETSADANGAFQWAGCELIEGKQVVALTIDAEGNTSIFSSPIVITIDENHEPANCSITE